MKPKVYILKLYPTFSSQPSILKFMRVYKKCYYIQKLLCHRETAIFFPAVLRRNAQYQKTLITCVVGGVSHNPSVSFSFPELYSE